MKLNEFEKKYNLIYEVTTGSRLYGTFYNKGDNPLNLEYESDYDYRGIFIAPMETKVGLYDKVEVIKVDECDIEYFEIKKFFELALENNPNIMDILFAPKDFHKSITDKGLEIWNNRHLFLSKKLKFTFSGYALSQLKRIRGHNKWITKYPKYNEVLEILTDLFDSGEIDFEYIKAYFGGDVAKYVTKEDEKINTKCDHSKEYYNNRLDKYNDTVKDYSLPDIKDYITVESIDKKMRTTYKDWNFKLITINDSRKLIIKK